MTETSTKTNTGGVSRPGAVFGPVNNTAPVAQADVYYVHPGQILNVAPEDGVLSNDSDPDGDTIHLDLVTQDVSHGALTLLPDGSFTYTPDSGFEGVDTFTYQISDGFGGVTTTTVTINVGNRAPVAVDEYYAVLSDQSSNVVVASGILANDTDPDGDTLTFDQLEQDVANGTLSVAADGSLTFTPDAGFTGSDRFAYRISDGHGGTASATTRLFVVSELGVETLTSDISLDLSSNDVLQFADNLTLTGTADLNATGNALANTLTGNSGRNILHGGEQNDVIYGLAGNDQLFGDAGNDSMIGGSGDDEYLVTEAGDRVYETLSPSSTRNAGGYDTVRTSVSFNSNTTSFVRFIEQIILLGSDNINVIGNPMVNKLIGNSGDNIIDGGLGGDVMQGMAGNDTYKVNTTADQIFETTEIGGSVDAGGIDTVISAVTFNLGATVGRSFVENLTLTGTANTIATGNALANVLTGNAGANRLTGGAGADTLLGGAGDDTYVVESSLDRVFETTTMVSRVDAGGVDTIETAITFNLNANIPLRFVENLVLTGATNVSGTGNALANRIIGNAGRNSLNGGLGNDTLTGGAGADSFVFSSVVSATNIDRITDFDPVLDTIRLKATMFAGLPVGTLAAGAFEANLTGTASDALDRIIYETDTGRLFFDSDGNGPAARVYFALLSANLSLTNADFVIY